MAQFARPDSDATNTGNGGFADIDESVASDADFWFGDNNQADELEVSLSNVGDPLSSSGHTFRYRIAKTNAGVVDGTGNAVTVTARLLQGATQIATDTAKTADGTWTQYSLTLSGAEADAITDYTDFRLEFVTSASGGAPANRRGGAVSWAELEVPDEPAPPAFVASPIRATYAESSRLGRATHSSLSPPIVLLSYGIEIYGPNTRFTKISPPHNIYRLFPPIVIGEEEPPPPPPDLSGENLAPVIGGYGAM